MNNTTQNCALLIMDMQIPILGRLSDPTELTGQVARAIAYARLKSIPVFFVRVGFRQGAPELNRNNKGNSINWERLKSANMEEWMTIDPSVAPLPGEIVITKRRISAFTGSDLEVVLRAHGIQHLILSGISTSGVVLSTVREAADKDYSITVLADCCADHDPEVHRVLTAKIFPAQADVMSVEEWMSS